MLHRYHHLWPLTLLAFALAPGVRVQASPNEALSRCTGQLQAIGRALADYQRDHRKLPNQLSDLYPKYVTDQQLFHCPADPTSGEPGLPYVHKDPRLSISYAYEFSADRSRGVWPQLGPFPPPDIQDPIGWGSSRLVSTHQRTFYGDRVPVVRCFHHQPDESDEEKVLNLTLTGQVYRSDVRWEYHPDTVAVVLRRLERDLKAGPAHVRRRWSLGWIEQYSFLWLDDPRIKALRLRLRSVAGRLLAIARKLPARDRRFSYRLAARFFNAAGEFKQAIPAIQAAMRLPAVNKWTDPDFDTVVLADAYRGLGQRDKERSLFQRRLEKRKSPYYMERIANAYEALGQQEKAAEWRLKADPGRRLVGKPAPPFSLPTPGGEPIVLSEALQGKKALLINFWFYG
jgi:tetratricopeptide (TPR) repeat protein